MFEVEIEMDLPSSANMHEHWYSKARLRRRKFQAWQIQMALCRLHVPRYLPCIVTFTRISPRMLDDDNLPYAFKYIRDLLAEYIIPGLAPGRADGDPQITWRYAQEKGKPKRIRITIEQKETGSVS